MSDSRRQGSSGRHGMLVLALLSSLVLWGCAGDGSDGTTGQDGPPGNEGPPGDVGDPGEEPLYEAPGLHLEISDITGGSGAAGRFLPGDTISVTFTVKDDEGNDLDLKAMSRGSIFVSGPTSNYQRVIASQSDLRARSADNGDGTWTYAFAFPIPTTYAAPLNDTGSFGAADGELQGQPLLDGTYTVGMQVRKDYAFEEGDETDVDVATGDFLLGSAPAIERREVVTNANCNACHEQLRAHGDNYRDVGLCLLCHTAGAEDRNVATAAGGTPGATIDFRVMIHKIHNGGHLPSVLGVATMDNGSRDYAATPKPLQYVGYNDEVADFSNVSFPVWPSLSIAMPRDKGYSALPNGWKTTDDTIRKGAVACAKCHGDPDGAGPLPTPAQGDLAFTHPSRQACGSCHDDVDWTKVYAANDQTMPSNLSNATCTSCHAETGDSIAVRTAHTHPLLDPAINPGLNFTVLSHGEAGTNDGDGTIDPGEKIEVRFTVTNDAGVPVSPSDLASISAVMSGPTSNYNLLQSISIPNSHPAFSAGAGDPPVYTMILPRNVVFEWVGTSTASATDAFPTVMRPHLNVTGTGTNSTSALTSVLYRSGPDGPPAATLADAGFQATWLDVAAIPAGLAKDDYLVLEDADAGRKEFVRVNLIDGLRIWLTSPLRYAHAAGSLLWEVPLVSRTVATHWTLDAASGVVTEVGGNLGTENDVIVSYTTEYVMPSVYPPPLVDTPDLGVEEGEWTGLPIASGTYTLNLYGYVNRVVALYGETQTYRGTSPGVWTQLLVGDATTVENYEVVSSGDNCYACHDSLWFHGGGRRGFETCVVCHATSAPEDRPSTTSPTPRVSASFREMLHKIHMSEELPDAATYPWEAETGFPAMPGGAKDCVKCHGNETWTAPSDRAHPAPGSPHARNWTFACASCHNTPAAQAHFDIQSPGDMESCEICHGADRDESVAKVHETR